MSRLEYLTVKEVAQYLNVSCDTVRRWDKEGVLKPDKTNAMGYRFYLRRSLKGFNRGKSSRQGVSRTKV